MYPTKEKWEEGEIDNNLKKLNVHEKIEDLMKLKVHANNFVVEKDNNDDKNTRF